MPQYNIFTVAKDLEYNKEKRAMKRAFDRLDDVIDDTRRSKLTVVDGRRLWEPLKCIDSQDLKYYDKIDKCQGAVDRTEWNLFGIYTLLSIMENRVVRQYREHIGIVVNKKGQRHLAAKKSSKYRKEITDKLYKIRKNMSMTKFYFLELYQTVLDGILASVILVDRIQQTNQNKVKTPPCIVQRFITNSLRNESIVKHYKERMIELGKQMKVGWKFKDKV